MFGQEYNPEAHAICGSDMIIKGDDASNIVFGDTLGDGKSRDGFRESKFHYMLANPPFGVEWKPQEDVVKKEHDDLGFAGEAEAAGVGEEAGSDLKKESFPSIRSPMYSSGRGSPGRTIDCQVPRAVTFPEASNW